MLNHVPLDVRLALRNLVRQRAFSVIVLLTLALGIGATATFFTILNAVALAPLPFPQPERLISVHQLGETGGGRFRMPYSAFLDLRQQGVVEKPAAYAPRSVTVSGNDRAAEVVAGAEVSADLFSLLGVPMHLGRPVSGEDIGARGAVISHQLWIRRFDSSAAAVGSVIGVDGTPYTVTGVAAPGFGFPAGTRVWVPLAPGAPDRRLDVVARLKDEEGVTRTDAQLRTVKLTALPLRDTLLGSKQRDAAVVLLVASGLVLVIACANLAGLLLAHLGARRHEIAVRSALGASRGRVTRQLLTESLILAVLGGAMGTVLAQWGVDLFVGTLGKPGGADWMSFDVDTRVLLFAFATSIATAMLFGVAPAIGGSRVDIRTVLQEDSRTSGRSRHRLRVVLITAQVAVSLGLLAGGASVVSSALRMDDVHPGFDREGLIALRVPMPGGRYDRPEPRMAYFDAALERLRAVPGVTGASIVTHLPLVDRNAPGTNVGLEGWTDTRQLPFASFRFVDANYFDFMRIPRRAGRTFTDLDARDQRGLSIVINETMARRYWPRDEAVGARLRLPFAVAKEAWFTVIGVVGDVAQRQLPAQPESQMYFPIATARDVTFVVRATQESGTVVKAAREAVQEIDPTLAVAASTMAGTYSAYARDRELQGRVLLSLALVAVLVSALGIYGVMLLTVTERAREIAIRMALGSTREAVLRLVLASGLKLASVGIGGGLLLGIAATSFLSMIFFGLQPFDLRVFAAAGALLTIAAAIASWWPARAAASVDPMSVMRR